MDAATEPDAPIHKVSLVAYAAVNAAIAEGFAPEEVLAIEGIEARRFGKAELAWKQRLVEAAAASEPLFERYRGALSAAEDWLTRAVTPLDEDAAGWMAFLHAFSSTPDAAALLASVGLGSNDVSRLARRWAKRLEEDAALQKQVAELGQQAPGALPAITVAAKVLRRSPGAEEKAAKAAVSTPSVEPAAGAEVEAFGLDRYAALRADLAAFPGDAARVLMKYGLGSEEARVEVERRWQALFAESPALERDYRALYAHFHAQAARAGEREAESAPRESEAQVPTAFRVPQAPQATPRAAGTMDVDAILARPALPFAKEAVSAEEALRRAEAHAESVQGPAPVAKAPSAGGTMDVATLLAGPALPFADKGAAERPAPASEPEKATRAPAAGGTMDVSALLAGPALPFVDEGAREAPAPPREPVPAQRSRPPQASGTADVASILAGPALPFTAKVAPAPAPSTRPPEPAPPTPAPPPPNLGGLSVEQYASLCVELHLRPERFAETLARYRIAPDARTAVDAAWQAQLARDPALHAGFSSAYAAYRTWLSASLQAPVAAPAAHPATPALSLEQYASLTVDLAFDPARRAETLLRYRLTESQKAQLDAGWGQRFAGDPAARAAFDRAVAAYRAWLAQPRR